MTNYQTRQGDLLIRKVSGIPKGKLISDGVLLRGEVTGHSHRIVGGKVIQAKEDLFFEVTKKAELVHEEHKTIEFKPGKYAVIRQREYTSKDAVRLVQD
jgi:hypothetical protein